MTGPAWLLWPPVGQLVRDCDGNPGRTRWDARSLFASSGRLPAEAAMNRYGGPAQDPAVAFSRRRHGPGNQHRCRVLEAVVLVRPDAAPVGRWGR